VVHATLSYIEFALRTPRMLANMRPRYRLCVACQLVREVSLPSLQGDERTSQPVTFCSLLHLVSSQPPECTHMDFELGDCGGDMNSKQYLETARTLLRVAQSMTDRSIAGQLKALAEDYERRAEKAAHADAAEVLARSIARDERSDRFARSLASVDNHNEAAGGHSSADVL
jgi:hypothetical protein